MEGVLEGNLDACQRHRRSLPYRQQCRSHVCNILVQKINPKGKVVVFGDMEEPQACELNQNGFHYSGGLVGWLKDKLTDYFFRHVTYLVANTAAYH